MPPEISSFGKHNIRCWFHVAPAMECIKGVGALQAQAINRIEWTKDKGNVKE